MLKLPNWTHNQTMKKDEQMSDQTTLPGRFQSLFFALGNPKDFSPAAWKRFLVPLDREKWSDDIGGGIVYELEDGTQYSLLLEYHPEFGLTAAYEKDSATDDDFPAESWISEADPQAMSEFVLLENGALHARGSFLDPDAAWLVLEAFLTSPTIQPPMIEWQDADDLEWPDPA